MGKLRFGISGPLFIGIFGGWAVFALALTVAPGDPVYPAVQTMIKNNVVPSNIQMFMLTLFIAATGLLASRDLRIVLKKYGLKFVVLGVTITAIGAGMSYLWGVRGLPDGNRYKASGIYAGALTSSLGLGTALESSAGDAAMRAGRYEEMTRDEQEALLIMIDPSGKLTPENSHTITGDQVNSLTIAASADVGMAYAVSYPFGLISVILGMMFIPKIFRIDCAKELEKHRYEMNYIRQTEPPENVEEVYFDFKSFALVCAIGYIAGAVEIPLGRVGTFSLGSTGGVFISAAVFGCIGNLGPFSFRMAGNSINALRDLSLATYLGMVGLTYGYRVVNALAGSGVWYALASLTVGISCVFCGFLIGHYLLKINWILLSGGICGGMTSNPGLGVASNVIGSNDPAAGYAAAYPFATAGMVLYTLLIYSA
jgi:putative transport protein